MLTKNILPFVHLFNEYIHQKCIYIPNAKTLSRVHEDHYKKDLALALCKVFIQVWMLGDKQMHYNVI